MIRVSSYFKYIPFLFLKHHFCDGKEPEIRIPQKTRQKLIICYLLDMERQKAGIIEETLEKELSKEAQVVYAEIIKKPEILEAFAILDQLPGELHYHNKTHTEDVIREAILFALADGASRETIEQQAVAAAWHDVGFIKEYQKNEPIAVELFKQSEAYKTLSKEAREEVIANILDTQIVVDGGIPSLSHERSSNRYILDADVSNFGRDDFFVNRKKIADELKIDLSDPAAKKGFYSFALDLLKNHKWETNSARMLRQAKKDENLRKAEEEFASL